MLCLTPPTEGFPWEDLSKKISWMSTHGQGCKCRGNIAEHYNRLSRVHKRYRQTTDDRQRDGRATAYSEREREFPLAKNLIDTCYDTIITSPPGSM